MQLPTKIPKSLYKFFWDVNPEKVNPQKKPYFVIQRLLDKGDTDAVKWVRNTFSDDTIADTFLRLRDFRTKVGTFWALLLDLPIKKVLCLQKPYLTMRRMHWPY